MRMRPVAAVNVTPLIDVLLVLLIVFMVIVPDRTRSLDASMPSGTGSSREPAPVTLRIETSGLALDDRPIASLAELSAELGSRFGGRPERVLLVRVDGAVPYASVVEAIDAAKGAGVERVGLSRATK